ncbi:MAG: TIGR02099 family protein [Gammaproteobacteria bacterium]|nr:TIGR02099 family protein [Gammaproteobacteria bacterium]
MIRSLRRLWKGDWSSPAGRAAHRGALAVARWGWYLGVVLVVVAALGITAARFWLPSLSERKAELETILAERSHRTVTIEHLETFWRGLHPHLRARGISLLAREENRPVARLDELHLRVSLLPLLRGKVGFDEITIVRPVLHMTRQSDGRITLGDIGTPGGAASSDSFARWILQRSNIRVEDGVFYWRDHIAAAPDLRVSHIDVSLRNDGDRHRVSGRARLPARISHDVTLSADFRSEGIPFVDRDPWNGRFYMHAVALNLGELPTIVRQALPAELGGQVNTQLWLDFKNDRLRAADGFVGLATLRVPVPGLAQPLEARNVQGQLSWSEEKDGWALRLSRLFLQLDQQPWPVEEVAVRFRRDSGETTVHVDHIRADDLSRLAMHFEGEDRVLELLRKLQPRGHVRDFDLTLTGPWKQPENFSGSARLQEVAVEPMGKLPGASGIAGSIHFSKAGGQLLLDMNAATLVAPALWHEPKGLDYLNGRASWRAEDNNWLVDVQDLHLGNPDFWATATLHARISGQPGIAPFVRLRGDIYDGQGGKLLPYYPNYWSKNFRNWLSEADIQGDISHVHLEFEGDTAKYPFLQGGGFMEVVADADEVGLNFAPEWPRINGARVRFVTNGNRFVITGRQGVLQGLEMRDVDIEIPDLRHPDRLMNLNGKLFGASSEVLKFLQTGPILKTAQASLRNLSSNGLGAMDVHVQLPLSHMEDVAVQGTYSFLGSELKIASSLELLGLEGDLDFTEHSVSGGPLTGRLLGGDVRLDVSTPKPGEDPTIRVAARGRVQAKRLDAVLTEGLVAALSGAADWEGDLVLEGGQGELNLKSNLVGMTSDFPPPLAKKSGTPLALAVREKYRGNEQTTTFITVADLMHGQFLYRNQKNGDREFTRGFVNVGRAQEKRLPARGLAMSISAAELNLDSWFDYYAQQPDKGTEVHEDISSFTATAERAQLFDRDFHQVRVQLDRSGIPSWSGSLAARETRGDMALRWSPDERDIRLDLDFLQWPSVANKSETLPTNPANVPWMTINAGSFRYGNVPLGSLRLETRPMPNGCEINDISLRQPNLTLTGSGSWTVLGKRRESRFVLDAASKDLGAALAGMGLKQYAHEGVADLQAELSWEGNPDDFSPKRVVGRFDLNASGGRFLGLDPGAGRLFGLFNMNAITRRLRLDFTDIFSKGYSYDSISGRVTLAGGRAYTSNMELHGPAADIRMAGETSLESRENKMNLTVLPQLGGNLALASGIYAGPAAGAVVYVLQKLLKRQLSGMIRYNYEVRGTWDDPLIERTETSAGAPPEA